MRKSIGFTTTAVVTLAMAIAANAVVFSAMNGFILRPVNVPEPHHPSQSSAPAITVRINRSPSELNS